MGCFLGTLCTNRLCLAAASYVPFQIVNGTVGTLTFLRGSEATELIAILELTV